MMRNIIRVGITSMGTLEAVKPPFNLGPSDFRENLDRGLDILRAAGRQGAKLVCLAETFTTAGMSTKQGMQYAVELDGLELAEIKAIAREYSMHIVAGLLNKRDGVIYNSAILIDGNGELTGIYDKALPTPGELETGVVPGKTQAVFDTDLGRIGLGICFDVNDDELWKRYQDEGADFVCWISAYDGGFPLQMRAWNGRIPIVTAVMSYHGRVVDVTGQNIASTSRWSRLVIHDLNLSRRVFHTDFHIEKLLELQNKYGVDVRVESVTEEHYFTVEATNENLSIDKLIADEGLISWDDYIRRSTHLRDKH